MKFHSKNGIHKNKIKGLDVEHMEPIDVHPDAQLEIYKNSTNKKYLRKIQSWRKLLSAEDSKTLTDKASDLLVQEMKEWFENHEQAIMFEEFLVEWDIHWDLWSDWCKKFVELKRAYDIVKMKLGIRREKAISNGTMTGSLLFVQPHYHPRWKEAYEWKESIRAKQEAAQFPSATFIEKAPDTGILTRQEREDADRDKE